MDKLEYKIGNIEIDKEKLEFFGKDPSESKHKFLVVGQGTGLIAYMGPKGHVKIVKQNKIESVRVLGGGSVYLNKNGDLVLDHLSYIYGAVPDKVACEFAKTPKDRLKALQKLLSVAPSHKGAEKLRSGIKQKIAKLREEIETQGRKFFKQKTAYEILA